MSYGYSLILWLCIISPVAGFVLIGHDSYHVITISQIITGKPV